MAASSQVATALTAADVMSRDVLTVHPHQSAAKAVQIMRENSLSGMPVVDQDGRCVGMFTLADFARLIHAVSDPAAPLKSCPFQVRHRRLDGTDETLCTLASGMCPLQRKLEANGDSRIVCSDPHEIVCDWTILQPVWQPSDALEHCMTSVPVTVDCSATIQECAARMLQAHIHHLVVVDRQQRLAGMLTSLDLVAALTHPSDCNTSE